MAETPKEDKPNITPDIPELRVKEGASSSTGGNSSGGATSGTGGNSGGGASSSTGGGIYRPTKSLKDDEESASDDSRKVGRGYTPDRSNSTRRGRVRFRITKRRAIGGGIAGIFIGVVLGGLSITQGPMQFVHFAQLLQKFHLLPNEEFGDGRGAKLMLYAMAGSTERGRLGVAGNKFADVWEKRMIKKMGVRPVVQSQSGRMAGYEILDEKKFQEALDNNPRLQRRLGAAQGRGVEIISRDEALEKGPIRGTNRRGSSPLIAQNHRIIDVRYSTDRGFGVARGIENEIRRSVGGPVAWIGSRMGKKRTGITMHFFNNVKKKVDQKLDARARRQQSDEYEKGILKRWSTIVKAGIVKGAGKNKEAREVVEETEQQTEGKSASESRTLRTAAAKAAGPAAVVGIICGVKALGDDAEGAKYANNVLPMMRMGMGIVTMGSQVMSGRNLNADELGVMSKQFFDEKTKTGVQEARGIQANLNKPQTGPPDPKESRLDNIGNKGDIFEAVDAITKYPPGVNIGTACSAIDTASQLPFFTGINSVVQTAIDGPLGLAGTSTEELMGDLIGVLNGDSVNPLAQGAELGALADKGTFLAANDQAISMGGTALDDNEVAQIKDEQEQIARIEQSQKSFAERYFDPYDHASLVGRISFSAPSSTTQIASLINPFKALSGIFSSAVPGAQAAQRYDYGVPVYGFSLSDQVDERFENPYVNEQVVEPQLASLNEKYGKCFGVTIGPDGSLEYDKGVNIFKLEKEDEYKDCRNDKHLEIFKRYRFYVADSIAMKSLACYEDDEQACAELGAEGETSEQGDDASDTDPNFEIKKLDPPIDGAACNCTIDPKGITLHWWGSQSGQGIKTLASIFRGNGLSSQLGITSDGEIYQMTKHLNDKANHAVGGNATTIGIEIEGGPGEFGKAGKEKYPKKFEAVVATVKYLVKKYNIPLEGSPICNKVVGIHPHSAYNHCPGAVQKDDIDKYYFDEVMKKVRE